VPLGRPPAHGCGPALPSLRHLDGVFAIARLVPRPGRVVAPSVEALAMVSFLVLLRRFGQAFSALIRDPETRSLPGLAILLLLSGTIFYSRTEGWSLLEALYFSLTTLTTIGIGDLSPSSDSSRIFTILYVLVGLGVLVAFVTALGEKLLAARRYRRAPSDIDRS
jgi:voltage-gated potassium channel